MKIKKKQESFKTINVREEYPYDGRLSGKDIAVLSVIILKEKDILKDSSISADDISSLARTSINTMYESVKTLEKFGYIKRENRKAENGGKLPNKYTVNKKVKVPKEDLIVFDFTES